MSIQTVTTNGAPNTSHRVLKHSSTSENCSVEPAVVKNQLAPTGPDLDPHLLELWVDQREFLPAVNVTWRIEADGCYCNEKQIYTTCSDKSLFIVDCFLFYSKCFKASRDRDKYS